jgi:hypothetical protein
MKKVSQTLWIRIAAIAVVIIFGASVGFAQKKTTKKRPTLKPKTTKTATTKTPAPKTYELKAGAKFRARMNEEISSKTSKVGDVFTVTVVDPMYADGGELVIPSGSIINGKVMQVTPAKRGGEVGVIDVEFVSVKLPNKKTHTINGTLTDLSAEAKSDDEGQVSGDKMKHRKIVFIGGGAAGGALLGAIVGGGKATAIGAAVGAGAGILAERLLKGEEAVVKPGTEFGIYLNKAIWLPKYIPTSEEATTTPTSN